MVEWLYALGGVMAGVLVDQAVNVWRDARRHRRERDAEADQIAKARDEAMHAEIRRLENTVSSNTGLLRGILAGRIDIEDFLDAERERGE